MIYLRVWTYIYFLKFILNSQFLLDVLRINVQVFPVKILV